MLIFKFLQRKEMFAAKVGFYSRLTRIHVVNDDSSTAEMLLEWERLTPWILPQRDVLCNGDLLHEYLIFWMSVI